MWRLGEQEEAYKRVSQVLKLNPLHQDARLLAAHLLSDLWRSDPAYIPDAIVFFEAQLLDEPEGLFERGELYLLHCSVGRREVARKIIEETATSVDAPPQALYHYAMLLEDGGKIGGAIYYLEKAFAKSQTHHIVHSLARLNKRAGDYRRAIEFFQLALPGVQEQLSILHQMGDCYHFLGEHQQCVRLCVESILLNPRDETSWANLAYSLAQLGKQALFWPFDHYLQSLQTQLDMPDDKSVGRNQDRGCASLVARHGQRDRAVAVGNEQDDVGRPAPPGVGQELEAGATVGEASGIAKEQGVVAAGGDLGVVIEQYAHGLAASFPNGQGHSLHRVLRQYELGAFHGAGLVEAD